MTLYHDQGGLESALTREEEYAGFMGLGQDSIGSQLGEPGPGQVGHQEVLLDV